MKKRNRIEAILFDMDGVIINSFESWYQAFTATLREFGKEEMGREEFKEKCWGPDLRHNLGVIDLDERAAKYCIHEQMNLIEKIELFQGIKEIFDGIKGKYKVGLVTNTPKENVYRILKHFNIFNYFDVIVTGDDVENGKPDAEIVIKACEMLKVGSKKALLIGDTESDFLAGKSAGCTVVGLRAEGDMRIENLDEFLPFLHKINDNG
jgi:HAD superfamily hydrolase (TIGR01549 family)